MNRILLFLACAGLIACSSDRHADAPMAPLEQHESSTESHTETAPLPPDPSSQPVEPTATTDPAAGKKLAAEPLPKGPWPFVGRRTFETRPAVTGTGTPHRVVEIMENGDVYFEYGQQNPQKGTMDGEKYKAGKFSRVLKCEFVKLDEVRYYIIGHTAIVEVDESGQRVKDANCCFNKEFDQETECPCQGDLFRVTPE